MEKFSFTIAEEEAKNRIDKYLVQRLPDYSRSFIQGLLEQQQVLVNQQCVKANYKLRVGDVICLTIPEQKEVAIEPENIPLSILYEDDDVLIVNKPKGMVVHPSAGHESGTLVNAIMYHCQGNLSGINGEIRPGIVHRIDMDTTGSLIVCKNDKAHQAIANQIHVHSVKRIYEGIVMGVVKQDEGTVESLIGRSKVDRKKMAVVTQNGKKAITHYRVLKRFKNATYMEFRLETGRTHQIRVHMASMHHPLLGDLVYGPAKQPYSLQGQTLHAKIIGFEHPTTREYVEFEAPLPEYFQELLKKLEFLH
ncbi:23S rRNA pseudouridine1911/1915/1917 synthase [Lachnospiraceae bacterium XBB1006]|nr:23S rRNA pseudouridine1911/1915/1917 synthase [Lachnospiraceae bacterium XBB1006]